VQSAGVAVSDKTITIGYATDPGNLDPAQQITSSAGQAAALAYDAPVFIASNGSVQREAISQWQAKNPSEYILTVTKGITFSDGSALTPQILAANINYIANPRNKSDLTGLAVPPGAQAAGDNATGRVTVKLAAPDSFFVENLSQLYIVGPRGLVNRKLLASHSDGSGPYVLSTVTPGQSYTYDIRKGYHWGPGNTSTSARGMPAKVILDVVPNETTAANELLSQELNIAEVTGPDRQRLASAHLFSASQNVGLGKMVFNQTPGLPTADPAVRKALILGINLHAIRAVIDNGAAVEPTGMFTDPKACPGDTLQGNIPGYDLAAAKSALSADGWQAGSNGIRSKDGKQLTLSLLYGSNSPFDAAAQLAAQEWKQLGVNVTLSPEGENAVNTALLGTGKWDIVWAGLDVPNPQSLTPILSGPVPPHGTNVAHLTNKAYDSLTHTAATQVSKAGCADWNRAEVALFKSFDVIPFADIPSPFWGASVRFSVSGSGPIVTPTSIRALG